MGSDNSQSRKDEMSINNVLLTDFGWTKQRITNDQFALFVNATGYVTIAEKIPD